MPTKPSPAQRANQITYFLKGDLKNLQVAYLRAGAKLATIRDEKLYRALGHASLEEYAEKRLGMRRAALYRYLQIYDWAKKAHPGWLAKHPKGFIPELYDAYGLKWFEDRLADEHVDAQTRKELEALRAKALSGKLTQRELDEFRHRGKKRHDTIGAVAASLRASRRRAAAVPGFPPEALRRLDEALDLLKSASGALARAVALGNPRGIRLSAIRRGTSIRIYSRKESIRKKSIDRRRRARDR